MRKVLIGAGAALLLGGGGAFAWMQARAPEPPPPPPAEERGYGDIPRDEYQEWMQDLGYTE
ncbi:MAG: hypothetical protein ACOZNI_18660 [Myxococcota bacterium]